MRDKRAWSDSQLKEFLRWCMLNDTYWHDVCYLASATGARAGELYALRRSDICVEDRLIVISRSYCHKTRRENSYTKTGIVRSVPVAQEVLTNILRYPICEFSPDHLLARSRIFDCGNQSNYTNRCARLAGLPHIRFHDFRAMYASKLLRRGLSLPVVMQICGWTQLSTAQRYLRLSGADVVGSTDQIDLQLL